VPQAARALDGVWVTLLPCYGQTNFYRDNKKALAFRLDPSFLSKAVYEHPPFGVFMIIGAGGCGMATERGGVRECLRAGLRPAGKADKGQGGRGQGEGRVPCAQGGQNCARIFTGGAAEFRGFHVRFRDVARGGIRLVQSRFPQAYANSVANLFDECYNLAATQQRKNKDIPEGGSKGVILLGLNHQDSGLVAFKKYIDGLLDLMLPNDLVVQHTDQQDILFLGPDEGTADLMDWCVDNYAHAHECTHASCPALVC
jgi:NAD-specific glutamate dehydrogenase